MAIETPVCDFGWKAPDFTLQATDGKTWSLADVRGPKGTLVMFICNHCPYVRGVIGRIVRDGAALQELGIGVAAICANDADSYPDDSFEMMGEFARANRFAFPYLHDESQAVARAYEAVCTPDFFGFDAGLGLQYRGRLDASRREAGPSRSTYFPYIVVLPGPPMHRTGRPTPPSPPIAKTISWRSKWRQRHCTPSPKPEISLLFASPTSRTRWRARAMILRKVRPMAYLPALRFLIPLFLHSLLTEVFLIRSQS